MQRVSLLILIFALVVLPVASQIQFDEQMSIQCDDIASIVYDGNHIWVKHAEQQMLSAFDPVSGERVLQVKLSGKGQYLAFDGRLLLTQNETKQIMAVELATGQLDSYIDLKNIQGERELYLEPLRSGEILGITCDDKKLWIACGAGYSTSIYEVDTTRQLVISQSFAPGPHPVSLIHYQGNLWVLDQDSRTMRCLKNGRQLVYDVFIELDTNAVALLDMDEKIFVARAGETVLPGVSKKSLNALVPDSVDTKCTDNYFSKTRRIIRQDGQRKVAVLISGDTAASGFNEFWTDVVIMYRILKARGYEEFYVLYAEGNDYNCGWNKYDEQMTDFAATKANVIKVFNALANGDSTLNINPMSSEDILFVYTFDHGASNGYLCLWNGERYSPSEMANAVNYINCARKMFYMQQCFSGAFKEQFKSNNLNNLGIVTACSNRQYAYRADTEVETYNGKKFYHGEFNWHFMSALAGKTPQGTEVNADSNTDGKVSILETFEYYQKMNSQSAQTPQHHSNPDNLSNETTP